MNPPRKASLEWSVERQMCIYIFGDDPLDLPTSLDVIKDRLKNQPYVPTTRMNHQGKLPPGLVLKWIEEDLAGVRRNEDFFKLKGLAYEEGCEQYDETGEYCIKKYSEWCIQLDIVHESHTQQQALELLQTIHPRTKISVCYTAEEYLTPQQTIKKLNDYKL